MATAAAAAVAVFFFTIRLVSPARNQHNEVIRASVAHAGNDWRLGAQEAPPAIVSLSETKGGVGKFHIEKHDPTFA